MNAISVNAAQAPGFERHGRWRRRVVDAADIPGVLVCAVPLLLGVFFSAGIREAEYAIYGLSAVLVLPYLAPFLGSTRSNAANALFLLTFVALGVATLAASQQGTPDLDLKWKALAATAVWASIYVIAFSTMRTPASMGRLSRWIHWTGIAISASVYLSALFHAGGLQFGEVLEFRDGSYRAFGPLGDQVSFIVALPALIALVQARPLIFGFHFGALLLTSTRGALLTLVVGVVAYLLIGASGAKRQRGLVWGLVSLAVAAGIAATPASSVLFDRIFQAPTNESYSFRWTAITSGVSLIEEHPLFGVGFNGFGDRRRAVAEDWLAGSGAENGLSRAANQFVQTATDGGLLAGIALLLFVAVTLRNAFRTIRWNGASSELVGAQLWLIAVLIGNQGSLWFLSDASTGFFIFAIAGMAAKVTTITSTRNHGLLA